MAFDINSLFNDPQKMALLMGGINMMASARGGNTDLSKGGLGYGLQQGLQGGIQGAQLAKGFQAQELQAQEAAQKKKALEDMLMQLGMADNKGAMNSTGVLRPDIQQGAQGFAKVPQDQRQMAAMALRMGDVPTAMKALYNPDGGQSRSGIRSFEPKSFVDPNDGKVKLGIPSVDPNNGEVSFKEVPLPQGATLAQETPWDKRTQDAMAAVNTKAAQDQNAASASAAEKAYTQLGQVRQNLPVYDEVIKYIDSGADTGVITDKFPSFKASTIGLKNAANSLGIGVVNSATFGALSEKELALAMATALPTNLAPQDLRKWVVDKQAAQEKMADQLESAAEYLGTPGNNISGWIKEQKAMRKQQSRGSEKILNYNPATGAFE